MKNPYANLSPTVWLLALISLINRSGAMVVVFFPLYLTQQMHYDITLTGIVLSIFGLGSIIGSYIGGTLTDKIGFLKVQIISLFVTGLLYLLLEHLPLEHEIIIAMFFIGFLMSAQRPAITATIAKFTTNKTRLPAYALNYQAANLGSAFGPALGGYLASIDYAWLFRVDGAANIAAAATMWFFFHKRNDKPLQEEPDPDMQIMTSWWRNNSFLLFLSLVFLCGFVFLLVLNLYPLYLKENYLLSNPQIGLVMGLNGFLIILLQMPISAYLKRFNLLHVIAAGGILYGLGYGILPLYSGLPFALLSMFLITMGEMTTLPQMQSFIVKIAPQKVQGKYFGLMNSAFSIPLLLTPLLGAYVYTRFGSTALWCGTFMIGLIIFAGFEKLRTQYSNEKMLG